MTDLAYAPGRAPRDAARTLALVLAVSAVAIGTGLATSSPLLLRVVAAAAAGLVLVGATIARPKAALVGLLAFLPMLGLVRRLAGVGTAGNDPLLLVAPAAVALLLLVSAKRGAFERPSRLTLAVLGFQVLAVLGVANPIQGGLAVGVAGLLFVLVPTLWFWVGRALLDDQTLRGVLRAVMLLGLAGAAYGLFQTYAGFPAHDLAWIAANPTYVALSVDGTTRAFGTFTAAAEYAGYTAAALVTWAACARRGRVPFAIVAIAVLGTALVLASSRGIFVLAAVALGIVVAARLGLRPWSAVVLGAAFMALLFLVAGQVSQRSFGDDGTGDLLAHQFQGLADPFNDEVSTGNTHAAMVREGIGRAFTHPLGHGTGSVTIAAAKYGGRGSDTETDVSNAATALGLPGLLAYLAIAIGGGRRAYQYARERRNPLALAVVGVLAVTGLQWLNGGQYALAPLPWLLLGYLDQPARARGVA